MANIKYYIRCTKNNEKLQLTTKARNEKQAREKIKKAYNVDSIEEVSTISKFQGILNKAIEKENEIKIDDNKYVYQKRHSRKTMFC